MEEIILEVQIRDKEGKQAVKRVRAEDFVPAIVYGGDQKPTSIKVNKSSYEKIMRHHRGQSVLFHLNVMEGGKKLRDYSAIVKDEQLHPVSDELTHIDFNRVSLTEEIEVQVPVEVKGEAIGVKRDGGNLEHQLWELDVVCIPTKIPEKLVVDVTNLEIGDAIHVKEIVLPEGVRTEHDPEAYVVQVAAPSKEEEEVEATDAEPEVIGKKEAKDSSDEAGEDKEESSKE